MFESGASPFVHGKPPFRVCVPLTYATSAFGTARSLCRSAKISQIASLTAVGFDGSRWRSALGSCPSTASAQATSAKSVGFESSPSWDTR